MALPSLLKGQLRDSEAILMEDLQGETPSLPDSLTDFRDLVRDGSELDWGLCSICSFGDVGGNGPPGMIVALHGPSWAGGLAQARRTRWDAKRWKEAGTGGPEQSFQEFP
ncbi:MAG: hypothetical protein ACK5TN_07870 [Acidobacteriota bacterium]